MPICRCVAAAVLLFKSSSWEICRFCGKKLLGLFYSFGFFGPKEEDLVSTMQNTGLANHSSFLVWSGKGYHLRMLSLWGRQLPYSFVLIRLFTAWWRPKDQQFDPSSARLLLTGEKAFRPSFAIKNSRLTVWADKIVEVLVGVREYYRVLQSITKKNLAHLLGPIFGLVFLCSPFELTRSSRYRLV